jgi:hypothetical protein
MAPFLSMPPNLITSAQANLTMRNSDSTDVTNAASVIRILTSFAIPAMSY